MNIFPCRVVSIAISRCPREVYAFASDPRNLPRWASGLASGIQPQGDHWLIQTPLGQASLHFTPANTYGVMDHHVTLPEGHVVDVPMRVVANGQGSLVTLILYHQPHQSDAEFERDQRLVQHDLQTLQELLEKS